MYENICRLCLSNQNSDKFVCLIENSSVNRLSCYGESVKKFAEITIEKDDKLPKKMCHKCLFLLKCAIYFKFKCEASEKILQKSIKTQVKQKHNVANGRAANNVFKDYSSNKNKMFSSATSHKIEGNQFTNNTVENSSINDQFELLFKDYFPDENDMSTSLPDDGSETDERLSGKQNDEEENEYDCDTNFSINKNYLKNDSQHTSSQEMIAKKQNNILKKKLKLRKNIGIKNKNKKINSIRKKYECKICKKVLANPVTYTNHMEYHTGCRYICECCGKRFPVLAQLQRHQVMIHGTGPYMSCRYCSYKAPTKLYLTEHERLHTGERPFTCDKCGLTFRRRAIWRKHVIHHAEKTVKCSQCPRKFYTLQDLQAHSNSNHERLYMYSCHKCDARYAKTSTVRKHLMERHGVPREMQGKILRINWVKPKNVEP